MNRFDASQSLIGQREMTRFFSLIINFTKDMKELELLFALGHRGNKWDQKSINAIAEKAHRGIALKML